jgi:hypothetical protein
MNIDATPQGAAFSREVQKMENTEVSCSLWPRHGMGSLPNASVP